MKLSPFRMANALAASFAIVHTSFDLLSLVAPNYLKFVFNSWFHGFNLQVLIVQDTYSWSLPNIIFGWFTSVLVAWVIGFMIGFFYNLFLGEK